MEFAKEIILNAISINLRETIAYISNYVIVPLFVFWARYEISERFKRKKEKRSAKDRIQIKEYLQSINKAYEMPLKIKSRVIQIVDARLIQNKELIGGIYSAADKLSQNAKTVIRSNFSPSCSQILNIDLIQSAKAIRSMITVQNLELTDPKIFMQEVKTSAVYPAVNQYISNLNGILHYKNGERLKAFEEITLEFTERLINKTLDIYAEYKKN